MGEEQIEVSVVVPTRARPEALRRCLVALQAQTVRVEVVVVEDVEGRGPAWARNEGVRRARGGIVCFTDDDCQPVPDWAEALAAPILAGEARVTAGPTNMAEGATAADRAWEAIVAHLQSQAAAPGSASPGFAATANLACERSLLQELPFDQSFPAAAGEDRDWAARAAEQGAAPRFVADAVVVHQAGMSVKDFLRQQHRYGRGAARYRGVEDRRGLGSPSFYVGLLLAGFKSGIAPGLLVFLAQAVTLAGAIRESAKIRAVQRISRTQ